jgi:hypothetical protein
MNRDKSNITTHSLEALSVFRGIYKRVAVQLDIDPSYVSRVARGQRNAGFVSEALRKEIQRALSRSGLHNGNGKSNGHGRGGLGALLNGHQSGGDRPAANRKRGSGDGKNNGHRHGGLGVLLNGGQPGGNRRAASRKQRDDNQGKPRTKKSASSRPKK